MCINPSARHCQCPACDAEHKALNRFIYTKPDNSIARWMLSDAWWTVRPPLYPGVRGARAYTGLMGVLCVMETDSVSGEIEWNGAPSIAGEYAR